MDAAPEAFYFDVCLPFLRAAQNADGGWGYRPGARSAVEPTCWAVLALGAADAHAAAEPAARAARWLAAAQLDDGAWPVFPGQPDSSWVTSLASLALFLQGGASPAVERGVGWVCGCWPAEGGLWWRIRQRLFGGPSLVRHDTSLRGWPWTPGTSSWVEPTCYALLLLESGAAGSARAARRAHLARAMLYDRMCPGGGWNCGNPMVYGVAGEPQVGPTAWALLTLRHDLTSAVPPGGTPGRELQQYHGSLAWLEQAYPQIQSAGLLALAHLCLKACGRPAPLGARLARAYAKNHFLQNALVASWAALALGPEPVWLARAKAGA